MKRYEPQIILPEVGYVGQKILQQSRVLVVGAGGLSATLLPQLIGSGIGYVRLYDNDNVALNNLHRQTLFTERDVGYAKVVSAQKILEQQNPQVRVEILQEMLNVSNVKSALIDIDLVVDSADNFDVTYLLSDICSINAVPFISASVVGRQGYVGGFCGIAPGYCTVFPRSSTVCFSNNCSTVGVMGPVVAVLGAIQAQMVISVLLGLLPSPLGCIVNCDFVNWHFYRFRFYGLDESSDQKSIPFIDLQSLADDDWIVELRSFEEAPVSIAECVERVSLQQLPFWQPPTMDRRIVLVCASGMRASQAGILLMQRGFNSLAILAANRL
ncbi:ThiF family adenylyltransferase [Candidatus Pantoea carbekii]|uniref:ThiF family adenylyltransferase n=1 Tax=Candidatus Pantoea carbekii TaxID=1235990 RepID=UPI0006187BA5|nr:ThiF family adenylyltransferase [Candidatus Pantoea carbekii]AKC32619.1 thiazole biosynthesis protein ThiF [Candidatus Pantoea carbekii]